METSGISAVTLTAMVLVSFPLALGLARLCLGRIMRMLEKPPRR